MRFISKNRTITHFSANMEPITDVRLQETITVETHDCYGGQIDSETVLRPDINLETMNQATGPIYVNGVEKGDVLQIDIEEIELDPRGIMVTSKGLGVLGDHIEEPTTKILPVKEGRICFKEDFIFPVRPMIGVIGVAPASGSVHCASPGDHGGNLDTKDITIGSKLYFPVFQDGALFALGDLHASMGDGELDGTGVEIGGRTTLTVRAVKGGTLEAPVVETADSFMFLASAKTLDEAIRKGSKHVVGHLQQELSLEFQEAYRLLSMLCDVRISQIVNPLVTVRIVVPKELLPRLFKK
ncbi:amidase [Bacillus thermophilus]|uniref:Amidase n=1 Tax=Siminovitchia thermophila TaxID=1245522 RepID=A0ABS2R5Z6_9BACI|nr:acetamidase/formamidase family protein [Siminovitchia thermophila]MBM7715034.1 amidase [Siminovitchia thermophila]ONK23601.1 acetamidase [Bacillus sp. VT-16-64]